MSYPYPLEHPIKVVTEKIGLLGLVGWFFQKFGNRATRKDLVVSERIVEMPILQQWLGRIFPTPEGDILEVGHAASSAALELASLGFSVTAIDLRPYPFTHKNLVSVTGNFLKHSFDKRFDCIYSISTIEHFGFSKRYGGEDDKENKLDQETFERISKLLKPDGHVVLSFPYARIHAPGVWFRVYTRADLKQKLSEDFNIEEVRYYRRDNNEWSTVTTPSNDPLSPHDGVTLFLLKNK